VHHFRFQYIVPLVSKAAQRPQKLSVLQMTDRHEDLEDLVLSEVHLGSKPGDSACSTCFSILQPAALEGANFHSSGDRQPDATCKLIGPCCCSNSTQNRVQVHAVLVRRECNRTRFTPKDESVQRSGILDFLYMRTQGLEYLQ
jgi:hypothetical protein